ncbi:MAG: patatin-like phospholipase family protein [Acetobacteraceae bacterium]
MPAIKKTCLQALAAELRAIRAEQRTIADNAELWSVAQQLKLSALCLSGGGIRSAAFCLGVLQGLARGGLLAQFDYLSTVSGGGYIGCWLQAMIHQRGSPAAAAAALGDPQEPPVEFRRLRDYTSYLAPEAGLFSTDTWANIVLYIRNVLLNWTVYLPLLVLPVLLAIFYRTTIWVIGGHAWVAGVALAVGAVLLAASIFCAARNLPDHRPNGEAGIEYASLRTITRSVYWPALGWAFLAPLSLGDSDGLPSRPAILLLIAYVVAMSAGYLAAWLGARHDPQHRLFTANFVAFGAATFVSTLLIVVGLALVQAVTAPERAQAIAVLAPLWLLGAQGIHSSVFVGLRRDSPLFDLDREWLARVSALKLRAGVFWAVFAGCSLLLTWVLHQPHSPPTWVAAVVALGSGGVGAWIGKQASSQVGAVLSAISNSQRARTLALNLLAGIFVLGLIAVLGMVTDAILGRVQSLLAADVLRVDPTQVADASGELVLFYAPPPWLLYMVQVVALVLLIFSVYWINRRVNVNRYSMHAVYRNRLTRAFLGSGRAPARRPEPFTQFDPKDNLSLAGLAAAEGRRTLFPVLNLTLNLTSGVAAAWSERKAMVFTATPLACGAPLLPAPEDPPERDADARGVYVATTSYAGMESRDADPRTATGLSLGTAMAISGAAVSPNWGYHSSTLTAFIMTLFNVRLGAWLPNPAVVDREEDLNLARPPRSLASMIGDLLGESGDEARAIYLSDGGHFDNLGLYEMLRRRCRLILAIDAGEDATCNFADLGDTLRKAAIDMQITVSFDGVMRIASRSDTTQAATALGYAIATIHYPEQKPDERGGTLLYLKPSVLPDIPADVRAYANLHNAFPHEPTLDQFFTESQFESYRALGEYQMALIVERVRAAVPKWQQSIDPETFFDKAAATYQQPIASPAGTCRSG